MTIVGLDWSRYEYDFAIMDAQGNIVRPGTVTHDTEAFEELTVQSRPKRIQI
jgi:hypothetical protein